MLGTRLAMLRKAAGMNQTQLGELLKISCSAVGMYEQGRREPSLETLAALSRIFGVSIDFLVTGRPTNQLEQQAMEDMLMQRLPATEERLQQRVERPFNRQELAVLFAAMLMEP